MSCWFCKYNQTEQAKTFVTFVIDHLGTMSMEEMASEISEKIPETKETIYMHFTSHTLHPSLRITSMLRGLLDLSDQMKLSLSNDDGHCDPKALDAFLKLQAHILNIYKMGDTNRLMFG